MINVLYIIWSLGLGGAEQVVINLAKGLDRKNFTPFICCLNSEGQFAKGLEQDGIRVFALNKVRGLDFSVVPKLVKIIKENDIHIVHTHLWGANFWGRMAAKSINVSVVSSEHGIQEYRTWLHFLIDRWLSKYTKKIIFVCKYIRENYWRRISTDYQKTAMIYNGINVTSQVIGYKSQVKSEFKIKDNEKVIAYIGRLAPEKGVGFFLNVINEVFVHRPSSIVHRLKILIVGDGPEKGVLESRVNESNELRDKVIFTGVRKDVSDILKITDILVLPSTREGLPMILLEAMSSGAIVLATRVGGTPELVEDGVNGYLVEPNDSEGLKNKLEYILSKGEGRGAKGEKDLTNDNRQLSIDQIRINARKTVEEKFSVGRMVSEHEGIYQKVLNGE